MDNQQRFNYLDELLLHRTGKRLDTLQAKILKGVLIGQKYADIAEDYHCTEGNVKDKASALWQRLSELLGEDICKGNLIAIVDRQLLMSCGTKVR